MYLLFGVTKSVAVTPCKQSPTPSALGGVAHYQSHVLAMRTRQWIERLLMSRLLSSVGDVLPACNVVRGVLFCWMLTYLHHWQLIIPLLLAGRPYAACSILTFLFLAQYWINSLFKYPAGEVCSVFL
jgi:hypothetical protein